MAALELGHHLNDVAERLGFTSDRARGVLECFAVASQEGTSPGQFGLGLELLRGKEQTVHADAGYTGADKLCPKKGRSWHIAMKRGKLKKMADGEQKDKLEKAEHDKASIRARVEHPFHTLKYVFGYTKAKFRGLAKSISQIVMLFALGNLYRARKKLMEIKEQ